MSNPNQFPQDQPEDQSRESEVVGQQPDPWMRFNDDYVPNFLGHVIEQEERGDQEIRASYLKNGDRLKIAFQDGAEREYAVTGVNQDASCGFTAYGASIEHASLSMRRVDDAGLDQGAEDELLSGSAFSPFGGSIKSAALVNGLYLETKKLDDAGRYTNDIYPNPIQNVIVQRRDDQGDMREVPPNAFVQSVEGIPKSESYSHARASFANMEDMLASEGFAFETSSRENPYRKYQDGVLVSARRTRVMDITTDEMYVYDAKRGQLLGMHRFNANGAIQVASIDATPADFMKNLDRMRPTVETAHDITSPVFSRLRDTAPLVTHTWSAPDQQEPTISIGVSGKHVGDQMDSGVREQRVRMGLSRDINPDAEYIKLSMDITPNENGGTIKLEGPTYFNFPNQGRADDFARTAHIRREHNAMDISLGKLHVRTEIEPAAELARMQQLVRAALPPSR